MTSQGQRFRRRALRRGYKVDEVDSFLDRVEATLAGEPIDNPVTGQDVHDVVFRVRFGGYDEWQVDLHLDRVERQLSELGERGAAGPQPQRRMAPPERMGPPGATASMPPMSPRPMAAPAPNGPPDPGFGRYDEPTYAGGFDHSPERVADPAPDRGYDQGDAGRHGRLDMTTEMRLGEPGGPPIYQPGPADRGMPEPGRPAGAVPGGHVPGQPSAGYPGPPASPPPGGFPGAASAGPEGFPGPGSGPPVTPPLPPEVHRVDQLRRTFQPRRFGSGYDRAQVDQLFEQLLAGMSGRGPMPAGDTVDAGRFDLVPGGYFEAEVDTALEEVRELLHRRR